MSYVRPSKFEKIEWLGENPKGRLGRMSVSVRFCSVMERCHKEFGEIRREIG